MARRTKEEAAETREQILDAAERMFHQRGVSRTSLADIAASAGVSRGAIYWHFENKTKLFQAMLERVHLPLEELARASEREDEPDPLGRMHQLLVRLLKQVELDPRTRRIHEILKHKVEHTEELGDLRQQMCNQNARGNQRIAKALNNAVSRGQLPGDLNCRRSAIALHAYISGLQTNWLLVPDSFSLANEAEHLVEGIMDMMRLSPSLRSDT